MADITTTLDLKSGGNVCVEATDGEVCIYRTEADGEAHRGIKCTPTEAVAVAKALLAAALQYQE